MNMRVQELEERVAIAGKTQERVDLLNKLAEHMYYHDVQRALEINQEAERLAIELDYTIGAALSILQQAYCYHQLANNETALKQLLALLPVFEHNPDVRSEVNALKLIGDIYHATGNAQESLSFYFKSLHKCNGEDDEKLKGSLYISIGITYGDIEDFDISMEYLLKALEIFQKEKHEQGEAVCLNNLGTLCREQQRYEEGVYYFQQAILLAERIDYKQILTYSHISMGDIYIATEQLDKALTHLYAGSRLASDSSDKLAETACFRNLGKIALLMRDIPTALRYCRDALALAEATEAHSERSALYRLYTEIYEAQGDTAKALEYYKLYHKADREVINAETQRTSKNLKLQFEVEKSQQEAEIHRLKTVELADALNQLEAANAELFTLNQEKNEFMGIAAHDLRNPLVTIYNDVHNLYEEFDMLGNDDILRIAQRCLRSSEQMLTLITNFLDYNRIETRRWSMAMERTSWKRVVEDALDALATKAKAKGIELHTILPADGAVLVDSNALGQITENLLSNAVKFSPLGTRIVVRLQELDTGVRLEVQDEGPGLTEEDKKFVFGKFQRLSAQPTGNEESTGLGLSIVKKLTEAMHGRVWCESEHGKGARFCVEFPIASTVEARSV